MCQDHGTKKWESTVSKTVLTRDEYYPIAAGEKGHDKGFWARWTGETRQPKRGEWYLSGAIIEAYQAKTDLLGDAYHIAKLWRPVVTTTTTYEPVSD
jgi:hypothetical protein